MTKKERERMRVLELVKKGYMKQIKASEILSLSYRQVKRIYKKYKQEGSKGLVHKNRGRESNRKIPKEIKTKIIELYKTKYLGFGPTLASEKILKQGIKIGHETLRKWLIEEELWEKRQRKNKHRSRRERKKHFGEMVQMDGSLHRWFGEETEHSCLMNMIDDATNTNISFMDEEETTKAAMLLLWDWISRYGIPLSIYCDRKNVYITDREPTIDEQLEGIEPMTAFGRACDKLGIKIIAANSPQAKGRIERNHGVYQDRFVKELKLQNIKDIDSANKLLKSEFIDELNKKFAFKAIEPKDYHRPVPKSLDLRTIFCYENIRVVSEDWVVRYKNRLYQIQKENKLLPRSGRRVNVCEWLDGSIHIYFHEKELIIKDITNIDLKNLIKEKCIA